MVHNLESQDKVEAYILVGFLTVLSYIRHKENIKRLINGTERKSVKRRRRNMSKVTVLGGGGWAIALAKVLNENGHNVTLWSALEREVEALTKERENKVGLPGVKIPEKIKITNDIKEAVKDSKMIVMAVASSL